MSSVQKAIALAIAAIVMLSALGISSQIKQTFACGTIGGGGGGGGNQNLTVTINANPTSGQAPLTVQFSATITNGTSPFTYSWNFAGLGNSSSANPQFTFQTAGNYTVTLNVTDSSQPQRQGSAQITIQVTNPQNQPDFTLSLNPSSGSVQRGQSINTTMTVNTQGGFTGTLNLSIPNAPAGVSLSPASVSVTQNGQQFQLTIATTTNTPTGTHNLQIQAVSGSITRQASFSLTVTQPDFTISLNPTSGSVQRGQSINTTMTVTTQGGFTGTLNLSIPNAPAGVSVTPTSVNVTQSGQQFQLTIATTTSTPTGTHNLQIQAVSGSITKQATFSLTVTSGQGTANYTSSYEWYLSNANVGSLSPNNTRNVTYTPPSSSNDSMNLAIGRQILSDGRANNAPDTIKILVVGDIGGADNPNTPLLGQRIASENPQVVILLGDYIYGFTSTSAVDEFFNTLNLSNRVVIAVLGERDVFRVPTDSTDGGNAMNPQELSLETYLQNRLYMVYTNSGIMRYHNVGILISPSAARGPASGAADSTNTTFGAPTMQSVSYASVYYEHGRELARILKEDPNTEWRIFVSHYPLLGWGGASGTSSGRDRNDLRFYIAPALVRDPNNARELEGFDITVHGHLHGFARSKVWLPASTAPYYAQLDSAFANASYGSGNTIDFSSANHGLITVIQGNGGAGPGSARLDYTNYPLSAYTTSPINFAAVENQIHQVGYTTFTITNAKGQTANSGSTTLTMRTFAYANNTWQEVDTFSITKSGNRNAGDITLNSVFINNTTTSQAFSLDHTNYYDWRWNHGKVYGDINEYESNTITISAWFRLEKPRDNLNMGWIEDTGLNTNATDPASSHFHIIGKTGVHNDTPDEGDETVNTLMITHSFGEGSRLTFTSEDAAGLGISKTYTLPNNQNLVDGVWHHIAVVRNGNASIQFYLDGAAVGSATPTVDPGFAGNDNTPLPITIGYNRRGSNFFTGQIANVAVWNSALSAADITSLFNNPTGASILGSAILRAYFPPSLNLDTAPLHNMSTLKDTSNYNNTQLPAYFRHSTVDVGSSVQLQPNWRYADSGSFNYPLFIAGAVVLSYIAERYRDILNTLKSLQHILPSVRDAHAQQNQLSSLEQACRMADVLPFIGVAAVLIAGVFSLIPRKGGTDI